MNELIITKDSKSLSNFTIKNQQNSTILIDLLLLCCLLLSLNYNKLITITMGIIWIKLKTGIIIKESILAIRGLGLQLTTTTSFQIPFLPSHLQTPTYFHSNKNLFLPLDSIIDINIQEGLSGWNIVYYLVVVVVQDNKNEVIVEGGGGGGAVKLRVGFQEMLPRLAELRLIWQGIRSTVFDELDVDESEVEEK